MKTNSQTAEQYVKSVYPCIGNWIDFMKKIYSKSFTFDAVSCTRLALIGKAAMKTFDYILVHEQSANVIRVSRMLNDMHDSAWQIWTVFSAQSKRSTGTRTLSLSPSVLDGLKAFTDWNSLDQPSFDPASSFNEILQGVTV